MENGTDDGAGLRQALRQLALRAKSAGLSRRVCALFLLLAGLQHLGRLDVAAFEGSYTGAPLNLAKPTEDTFDWGDQVNFNFQVVNDTFTSVAAATTTLHQEILTVGGSTQTLANTLGASTQTLANSVGSSTQALANSTSTMQGLIGLATGQLLVLTTTFANTDGSGSNSDITALTGLSDGGLKDGVIYGQDIAQSTITLNKLNDSGCNTNEVPKYNGTRWACGTAGTGNVDNTTSNTYGTAATEQLFKSSFTAVARVDLTNAYPAGWTYYAQDISSVTTAFFSKDTPGNTAIPHDDTQPQLSTEGMRVLTATMTLQVAVSTVEVSAHLEICEASNGSDYTAMCIYADATQNPICCGSSDAAQGVAVVRGIQVGPCKFFPGDTSSHVYTLKAGMNAANNLAVNGCTAREYGGSLQTSLRVREERAAP